jgi:hypothetical protein
VVEPGVTIVGESKDARLDIYGTVHFLGTEEEPIHVTSARDVSDGSWYMDSIGQGEPQGGDWSRIHVHQGAVLDMTHTTLAYGGGYYLFGAGFKHYSHLIYNEGQTTLSHVTMLSPYIETSPTHEGYNAMIWMTTGTVHVSDSMFQGGNMAVSNENMTKTDITIERSVFSHLVSPRGAIVLTHTWPELHDNVFVDNSGPPVVVSLYTFTKNTTIPAHSAILFSSIVVLEDVTVDVEEGVSLGIQKFGEIDIYGTLNIHGTPTDPVVIRNATDYWKRLSFHSGSQGHIAYTTISGGGRSGLDRKTVMIDIADSDVVFEHSDIVNARQPTDILIRLRDSRTSFTSGHIGYTGGLSGKYGIDVSGGETLLDDMLFTNLTRALVGNDNTTVVASNMSTANFVGITDKLWVPSTLVQFVSEPVPVGEEPPQQFFSFAPPEEADSEFVELEPSAEEDNQSSPEEMSVIEPKEEQLEVEENSEDSDVDPAEVEEEELTYETEGAVVPEDTPEEIGGVDESDVEVVEEEPVVPDMTVREEVEGTVEL